MPATLLKSSRYTKFVSDRDAALERIHQNAQIDLSRILFEVLEQVDRLASSLAMKAGSAILTQQISGHFEQGTRDIFTQAFPLFIRRITNLRRNVFVLVYSSELEAIGRATQRKKDFSRGEFKKKLQAALSQPTIEGPLDKRIWHDLMTLRRRIIHAFELGVTQELKPHEIVQKVKNSFPKIQVYKRPPKALTKVRESEQDPDDEESKDWFDFGFIDDADWDMMVDAYKDTDLPASRFDNQAKWDPESGLMKYNWELEQEATEDFVRACRAGQVDAASDLGVKDFVWVAILDDKTCEDCCLPRNGKTTSEIEQMDDDCGVIVPPAHFNCRCQIAPVASTDEVQGPDWSSFNNWLEKP